ncbi:hypothetical protein P7228_05955 [Altererythrobacter arenosus]|uniref:Uncharacterized protein n=1 Tax=Altererythrobacter arenosus TaxID=3032592 RepID=A0ABY8G1Q6_9SPHN|nr:hypothetical protein [Altererythrobacter sp. CAU 1644]WFL78604.1 hypothetical protein P7228_05955 [Altererythrobacter sp. CAU 1644]
MSLLFASLLVLQAGSPAPAPQVSPEVSDQALVIGERLKTWKGGLYKKDGQLTCRIEKSTGDPEIDAIRCGALLRCFGPNAEKMDAIAGSDLPREDRNRRMQELAQATKPCLEGAHKAGTMFLAEKRARLP